MHEPESIKQRIIEELKKGDKFAGELKDALRIERYPELWTALKSLKDEGKVEHYLAPTPPSATLAYKLIKSDYVRSSPILPWGRNER